MKRFIAFLLPLLALSCSKDMVDVPSSGVKADSNVSYKVSEDQAIEVLSDFLESCSKATSTRGCDAFAKKKVGEIKTIRFGQIATKSCNSEMFDMGIDTLMYAINFENNQGFALLSADRRTEPILAIIDDGSFDFDELSEKDAGFLCFLERAIVMEKNDIINYSSANQTRAIYSLNGYTVQNYSEPLLNTKWGQYDIYAHFCPNGYGGCAAVATAQILSFFQYPAEVNWSDNGNSGSSYLHWPQIIADCDSHNGMLTSSDCSVSGYEVANLIRYLGLSMDATYRNDGTEIDDDNIVDWFNQWTPMSATEFDDFDESDVVSALYSRNPVFMSGFTGRKRILWLITYDYTGGHGWVLDGIITASKDGVTKHLMHCNWGANGQKNGYYLSDPFNTTNGAELWEIDENQQHASGPDRNYQYCLEYSVISGQ